MTANLSASSPHDYRRLDATPETSAAMIREHAPKTAAVIGEQIAQCCSTTHVQNPDGCCSTTHVHNCVEFEGGDR